MRRLAVLLAICTVCGMGLEGCRGASPEAESRPSGASDPTVSASPSESTSVGPKSSACVDETLRQLSVEDRVGQLIMLGFNAGGPPQEARRSVRDHGLGAVTMIGRSYAGTSAIRKTTQGLQAAATIPLFVATDQEGGQVQVLHGPGFPEMPSAEVQGQWPVGTLERRSTQWGRALADAGVSVNLAPVLDVVPESLGAANVPIGLYDRGYGSTARAVTSHGLAFAAGMEAAGITPVVKHFPGLGAVRGNPDVTTGVTDSTTGKDSAALAPFRAAVDAGVPMVMVSSATYSRLDPKRPALFSPRIVTDLLRRDLGFRGVIVSDDVGAATAVIAAAPVAQRGIRFLEAGGDVVLTVQVADVPVMIDAMVNRADRPGFAALVEASARRVLAAKDARAFWLVPETEAGPSQPTWLSVRNGRGEPPRQRTSRTRTTEREGPRQPRPPTRPGARRRRFPGAGTTRG